MDKDLLILGIIIMAILALAAQIMEPWMGVDLASVNNSL